MPLSTVCVSTVSGRPRLWSSYSNIRVKDLKDENPNLMTMNSTEEISSYRNPQDFFQSPTLTKRTLGYSYDFPEKSSKKEKKWTLGSLFRRKRKEESDSSSEEDQKKGFLGRRRRKSQEKRKKPKPVGTFDHVVLPRNTIGYNGYNHHEDTGILSDPSYGFSRITAPPSNTCLYSHSNNPSFNNGLNNSIRSVESVGSADSLTKKSLRKMTKARAVARRTTLGNESSSDEDSHNSKSSIRMRSDESLARLADSNHSKRSRAARTERYLKRHSRDGENPHNYLKLSDDSSKSPSRSPNFQVNPNLRPYQPSLSSSQNSNLSGLSTIPPSHGTHIKFRVSNSTSNPSYKPPLSMNEYNNSFTKSPDSTMDKYFTNRSVSCDANIHKAPSLESNNVLHVQFPVNRANAKGYRNLSLVDASQVSSARYPPQPPPRDPTRSVVPHYFENGRPNTYYFESCTNQTKNKSFQGYLPSHNSQSFPTKSNSFNFQHSFRSNSDMHLPRDPYQIQVTDRPASATPEPKLNKYSNRRNERHTVDNFNYLTDKKPRSRKPIVIQANTEKTVEARKDSPTQKALDFWKQIEENVNKSCRNPSQAQPNSTSSHTGPQMFTSTTQLKSQVFLPSVLSPDASKKLELPRNPSPFKPVSPTVKEVHQNFDIPKTFSSPLSDVPKDDSTRKSTNLEEALNELEAIYNSLKLGDEDLLERAEQRENETAAKKLKESKNNTYLVNSVSRGALSDSSFSYEQFDQVDSPKRKRISKKNKIPDTKEDDMYNRKIIKEKSKTISDPQASLNAVSYLLSSPLHNANFDDLVEIKNKKNREPDITYDDVVFRNVKRLLSSPKTVDPQPPFGIPLGPVTPAPNTDYLHAVPCEIYHPPYKSKKIPDIVKDDLAFRNLRKDSNKEPALPLALNENIKDSLYPNEKKLDLNYLKKRRAVRSLSANIGNILIKSCPEDRENEFKNLTDIADAMEIARRVLQEKGKNITETKKAFLSDSDARPTYTNGDSFKESRQKFLNGLKNTDNDVLFSVGSKPPKTPRGLTPERKGSISSTRDTHLKSPLDTESTNSSLDDLLNALAKEAKITTDRITKELEELELQKKFREREEEERKIQENKDTVDFCKKCAKNKDVELKTAVKEPSEIVKPINSQSIMEERAQLVQSPYRPSESEREDPTESKGSLSEPDYENIDSDNGEIKRINAAPDFDVLESDTSEIKKEIEKEKTFNKCGSPFIERKAELASSFQELKKNIEDIKMPNFQKSDEDAKTDSVYDNLDDTSNENSTNDIKDKTAKERFWKRIPRWLRPLSYPDESIMAENRKDSRDRIARYKEERRKQLAEQFGNVSSPTTHENTPRDFSNPSRFFASPSRNIDASSRSLVSPSRILVSPSRSLVSPAGKTYLNSPARNAGNSSSSSEGPRQTRASKLRAIAAIKSQSAGNPSGTVELAKSVSSPLAESKKPRKKLEKDKSHKRKSNLNRSLTSEEVPPSEFDDPKALRRRRRFFPPEVLELGTNPLPNLNLTANENAFLNTAPSASTDHLPVTSPNTTFTISTPLDISHVVAPSEEKTVFLESNHFTSPNTCFSVSTPTKLTKVNVSPLESRFSSERSTISPLRSTPRTRDSNVTPLKYIRNTISPLKFPSATKELLESSNSPTRSLRDTISPFRQNSSRSTVSPLKQSAKKSELAVHMENARRGIKSPSISETHKYKPFSKRNMSNPNPPGASKINYLRSSSNEFSTQSDKENSRRTRTISADHSQKVTSVSDNEAIVDVAKRMEEITAFTRETLAKVEELGRNRQRPMRQISSRASVHKSSPGPSSILKNKRELSKKEKSKKAEDVSNEPQPLASTSAGPVSILKRKVTQEEKTDSTNHTPPVTFSPSVREPTTTNRKQGILKKRRSLDESTVMRHRSCSPDISNGGDSGRSGSILKGQRRSSLEDLHRIQSAEPHLHGILKRKTLKYEDDDQSLNSPQGILKKRSGASSAGSTSSTPHVSITTAVILAAAEGAEMILHDSASDSLGSDSVRPILKKKSFSDEHPNSESSSDAPRPILKKKSSTDTDDGEDRPRPILKQPRSSLDKETLDTGQDRERDASTGKYGRFSLGGHSLDSENEVRPILRSSLRAESPRPRLSFCEGTSASFDDAESSRTRHSRRSNTICADFNLTSNSISLNRSEDRDLKKARQVSVLELAKRFETIATTSLASSSSSSSLGSKKTSLKRSSDRYRTQPVTSNELEESRNLVKQNSPSFLSSEERISSRYAQHKLLESSRSLDSQSQHSLLDFTSSLEEDGKLNCFLSSSFHSTGVSPESPACYKMSSDSAFQSLGDGLELEEEEMDEQKEKEKEISEISPKKVLPSGPMSLASQMKAIAEEARKKREDFGERRGILKPGTNYSEKSSLPRRSQSFAVSSSAFKKSPFIDSSRPESAKTGSMRTAIDKIPDSSASKDICRSEPNATRLKPISIEVSSADKDDEGISCNDSGSDSEISDIKSGNVRPSALRKSNGEDDTSEGESSGGREVKSIFRNELNLSFRNKLEGALSKSRSHTTFGSTLKSSDAVRTSTSEDDFRKSKTSTGLRRSQTHTEGSMPRKLADIKAALQNSGQSDWMKRVPLNNNFGDEVKLWKDKNRYNDELSKSLLASKKDELDTAQKQWRSRVEKSDAEKFSVAGKMGEKIKDAVPTINIPAGDNKSKTPQAKRFKGKEADSSSTPSSPEKGSLFDLTRSRSAFSPFYQEKTVLDQASKISSRTVTVVKPDDETFKHFFESVSEKKLTEAVDLNPEDFDKVERQSLLVIKKDVRVQRRRVATKNPIKALASRTDIADEYTEVITGVAEREKKRLNIEKLAVHSDKAVEALAGLMSNEDFKSVALKKGSGPTTLLPYKSDLMLLQIKGRRHVQTRLVEPVANSINEGDCYVLVTPKALYNYVGAYSNVIEQARASDVTNHIQKTGDMGCTVSKVNTISNKTPSEHLKAFWKALGADEVPEIIGAGNPLEDETFESNILNTNMIYTLEDGELVPYEQYWGKIPKFEMLKETNIIVFDFGSEMYVWSGKNANLTQKRLAMKLARQMWEEGYDYSDCNVCPLNVVSALGERNHLELSLKAKKRPDWALFCKLTQHRETVLFQEKFLDWPHFNRVIRVKSTDEGIRRTPSLEVKPCNVDKMLSDKEDPDLVVNTAHLGRGDRYFDEETRREFTYDTLEMTAWRISEHTHEKLDESSLGQFHSGDSYIYCWRFRQTVKGRELGGGVSKYSQVGRDRCIFFCWQGNKSSVSEKCLAAFLTVELDKENAPQIRVVQGSEPAAFLRLFDGTMVIHQGDYVDSRSISTSRLFMVRAELEPEVYLMEVPLSMASLRSRGSFILVNVEDGYAIIWHGCKSTEQKRKVAKHIITKLAVKKPPELFLDSVEDDLEILETEEGCESEEFLNYVGDDRDSYSSLLNSDREFDFTPRMYKMTSITGSFQATEILCPHRSELTSPYPFVQSELYSASQPVLFLLDNKYELWLWHGWWPQAEEEEERELSSDQTGSGAVRWQAERKAAMQTAIEYWKKQHEDEEIVANLVWAGLEPLEFQNLFPIWETRADILELNIKETGKNPGDKIPLKSELARLTRTTYPLADLMARPLPEGVDPTQLEIYLSNDDFEELLSMSKDEFQQLPSWKQTALKKEKGLF